ncbi:MAG: NAD(P)-dependent oxidoreductase [Thermoplasmata archaeon]
MATPLDSGRVGFLGLGLMGVAHAARLQSQGVPLVVYNRTGEKTRAFVAKGARAAQHPSELGTLATSGVVFVCVSDARAVERVTFDRHGLARGMAEGSVLVNLSTIAPAEAREIAERLTKQGIRYVDAPVGGSVLAAREGQVILFAGGNTGDVERVRPYAERMSRSIEYMGPVGAGSAMKLVNNLLTVGNVALLAEALVFGEGLGIERPRLLEVLSQGGARSAMMDSKKEGLVKRQYAPQFRLALARKDLRLIEDAAASVDQKLALTREVRRLADEALELGRGDEDFSTLYEAARARFEGRPQQPDDVSPTPADAAH